MRARDGGVPTKKQRRTEAQPAGAVDLLRKRVAAFRAGEIVPKTRRWRCGVLTEICWDSTSALLTEAETRRQRPRQRHSNLRRGGFSERSDGESASEESGAELRRRYDARVRQVVMNN